MNIVFRKLLTKLKISRFPQNFSQNLQETATSQNDIRYPTK